MRGKREERARGGEEEGGEDGEGAECGACQTPPGAAGGFGEFTASTLLFFFLPACAQPAFPVSLVSSLLVDNGAFFGEPMAWQGALLHF